LYDASKLGKIDYVNKNAEIKNIYRSYNAVMILTAKDNLELLLEMFVDSLERIVYVLKDAFDVKNNACMEHFMMILKALIVVRPEETLDVIIKQKKFPLIML
jgi:hypothetical protein